MSSRLESPLVRYAIMPLTAASLGILLTASSCDKKQECLGDQDCDSILDSQDRSPAVAETNPDVDGDGFMNGADPRPYDSDRIVTPQSPTYIPPSSSSPSVRIPIPPNVSVTPGPQPQCVRRADAYPDKDNDGYVDNSICDLDALDPSAKDDDNDQVPNIYEEGGCVQLRDCDYDGKDDNFDSNDHLNEKREESKRQESRRQESRQATRTSYSAGRLLTKGVIQVSLDKSIKISIEDPFSVARFVASA